MTADVPDEGEELVAEIFGQLDVAPTEPTRKQFMPWHRPRKQFVRREQWWELVRRLYEGRPDGAPLRYLGLPGVDLIDLRYLHDRVCNPVGRPLRFLGFN